MTNLYEVTISSHFARTRADRCARINEVLGGDWGEIICAVHQEEEKAWLCVTNTGLYAVLNEDQSFLITCYLATYHRARDLYDAKGEPMPKTLRKTINRNGALYFRLYAEQM